VTPDLCIDIGNTRLKWYAMLPDGVPVFFASTHVDPIGWIEDLRSVERYLQQFPRSNSNYSWAIAGVNPARVESFAAWARARGDQVLVIDHFRQVPIELNLHHPERVGIDRLLGALAVRERKEPGNSAIFVDAGTAVTVNAVSAEGVFLGGAIAPGLRTMRIALQQQTAKLPLVESEPEGALGLPGRSTHEAIYFGTQELFLGGVERLIRETARALPTTSELYFTGGDGNLFANRLSHLQGRYDPCLTVEGLRLAANS